ncbi:MAG: hypothetical protein ACFFDT_31590 [Candidatus Hodarchaeota archaeon]
MNSEEKPEGVPVRPAYYTNDPFGPLFKKVTNIVKDTNPRGKIGVKWYFEKGSYLFEFWPFWDRVIYEYTQIQSNVLTTTSVTPSLLTTNTFLFADYCKPGYPLEFHVIRPPLGGYWYLIPRVGSPIPPEKEDMAFFFERLSNDIASFLDLFSPGMLEGNKKIES